MKLDEAIRAAIEYEAGVHRVYKEAMDVAKDETGRKIFRVLCEEERGHLDYLKARLHEWQENGKITVEALETTIPDRAAIDAGLHKLRSKVAPEVPKKYDAELQMLERALQVEVETSKFYEDMVNQLEGDGRRLFERFVEIEEGHQAIVQAEIQALNGMGFWFDTPEFNLEGS